MRVWLIDCKQCGERSQASHEDAVCPNCETEDTIVVGLL